MASPAADALARMVAALDGAMVLVTCADGEDRAGCLVGFHTQTSIDPPRFLACISRTNRTHRVAARAPVLAVHRLGPGDRALAELFGAETGDEVDKFARCRWRPGPGGAPLVEGVAGWVVGDVVARVPLGDHTGHLLSPRAGSDEGAGGRLPFGAVRDLEAGHRT